MDRAARGLYTARMDIGTRIFTWLNGRQIGRDADGNTYYVHKRPAPGTRARRWVIYAGPSEASAVPPEWHAWLHFTVDEPIKVAPRPWLQRHRANPTGTPAGYRPSGHDYRGGQRARATGDYEAWTPDAPAALPPPRA